MNLDDPRLTTFALGEVDALSADELAQIESLLKADEAARQFVEETRQTAGLLRTGLALGEPLPMLTAQQQQAIAAASVGMAVVGAAEDSKAEAANTVASGSAQSSPRIKTVPRQPRAWARWAVATAACAALATAATWNIIDANRGRPIASKPEKGNQVLAVAAPNPTTQIATPTPKDANFLFDNSSVDASRNHLNFAGTTLPGTQGLAWEYLPSNAQAGQQIQAGNGGTTNAGSGQLAGNYAIVPTTGTAAPLGTTTLALNGVNSYAGATTVTGGVLDFNKSGGGTVTLSNGGTPMAGDVLLSRGDFQGMNAHYRNRGAEGITLLEGESIARSGAAPTGTNGTQFGVTLNPVDRSSLFAIPIKSPGSGANTATSTSAPGPVIALGTANASKDYFTTNNPTGAILLTDGTENAINRTPLPQGGSVPAPAGAKPGTPTPALVTYTPKYAFADFEAEFKQTPNTAIPGSAGQDIKASGKQELATRFITQVRQAEEARTKGDTAGAEAALKNANTTMTADPGLLTLAERQKFELALGQVEAKLKVEPASALAPNEMLERERRIQEGQNRGRLLAVLTVRSQEQIRGEHYKEARGILDQILQQDPGNVYAKAASPQVDHALVKIRKNDMPFRFQEHLREAEAADTRGDSAASAVALKDAKLAIETSRSILTAPELAGFEAAVATAQTKLKIDPAKVNELTAVALREQQGQVEANRRKVIAALVEKSQDEIRARRYTEAETILDQILLLDPKNDFAVGAKPLVNDNAKLQAQRGFRERQTREFTIQLNSAESEARDAIAKGDRERAISAINRAKQTVNGELPVYFDVAEIAEAKARIAQIENTLNNNESYARLNDNPFKVSAGDKAEPLSTFSIDVDTASYSNIRRFIDSNQLPPPDAVRIEEMLNYFPYSYEQPAKDSKEPFKAAVEVAACPWNASHRLARVAIKGRELAHDKRPVSNLVFLIDVSGSMNEPKKLPLVKAGLQMMVKELTENDRVALVVYAGAAGLVLPSTCADPIGKEKILGAIENLSAGGSTNGGMGIQLAYDVASSNFIKGGTNRVLLATDGDWNVGVVDKTSLDQLIIDKAKSNVFLSVLGFGFGNLKDSTMESLADKGNGHYAYIDSQKEARKVLVEEMSGTLVNIAKDVKIQIEFNPAKVESYRLIGYENRMLRAEDFNNDKVDAGEIGAGHHVTALYEIVPADPAKKIPATPATTQPFKEIDPLVYATKKSDDLFTLKLRYKEPEGDKSAKLEYPVADSGKSYAKASEDFKFAAAVAEFGMILRNSPHKGNSTLAGVIELADEGKGKDEKGYRNDFVNMAKRAKAISNQK